MGPQNSRRCGLRCRGDKSCSGWWQHAVMTDLTGRAFMADDGLALLARTPGTLDSLLRGLPDAWVEAREAQNTWTTREVVGHLVLAERTNWVPRARHILEHGESRAFEEFTRYPEFIHADRRTLPSLLDEFATIRRESLQFVGSVRQADMDLRGQHPALGVVTLRQLLSAWVVHDLDHVMQITRVLARQYTEAVGPWRTYLRIVREEIR